MDPGAGDLLDLVRRVVLLLGETRNLLLELCRRDALLLYLELLDLFRQVLLLFGETRNLLLELLRDLQDFIHLPSEYLAKVLMGLRFQSVGRVRR